MSEIPDDIMKVASSSYWDPDYVNDPIVLARAILAERERCWFIVKEKSEGDLDLAAFLIMKGDK